MRLGETGLNIVDYLDAVEDEILRDDVGQIYYKNKDCARETLRDIL